MQFRISAILLLNIFLSVATGYCEGTWTPIKFVINHTTMWPKSPTVYGLSLNYFNNGYYPDDIEEVNGIQFGIRNITGGPIRGIQLALLDNGSHEIYGIQASPFRNSIATESNGFIIGGINFINRHKGIQIAWLFNYLEDSGVLIQAAPGNVAHDKLTGLQLGLFNDARRELHGLQLGIINIAAGDSGAKGLQGGIVNITGSGNYDVISFRGLQIGLVNICKNTLKGMQLGFINIARRKQF